MPNLAPSTFLADLTSPNTHKPTTQTMKHTTQWHGIEKSLPITILSCYLFSSSGILP